MVPPSPAHYCRIACRARRVVERSTTATDWVDGLETGWKESAGQVTGDDLS